MRNSLNPNIKYAIEILHNKIINTKCDIAIWHFLMWMLSHCQANTAEVPNCLHSITLTLAQTCQIFKYFKAGLTPVLAHLPKTKAQVFQYWGDWTNSYFIPQINQLFNIFSLKTYTITLKLMWSQNFPIKTLKSYPKLIIKRSFYLHKKGMGPFL